MREIGVVQPKLRLNGILLQLSKLLNKAIITIRDHPFKMSASFRGEGVKKLAKFVDG